MEHFEEAEWVIENFSFWNEEVHGKSIRSLNFRSVRFDLHPCGRSGQERHMATLIYSPTCSPLPPGELTMFGPDGSLVYSQQVTNPQGLTALAPSGGPEFEKVVSTKKKNEADRLTLRYRCRSAVERKLVTHTVIRVVDTTLTIDPTVSCDDRISIFKRSNNRDATYLFLNIVTDKENDKTKLKLVKTEEGSVFVRTGVSFKKSGVDALDVHAENDHLFRDDGEPWTFFSTRRREVEGATLVLRLRIADGETYSGASTLGRGSKNSTCCISEQKPSQSPVVTVDRNNDTATVLTNDLMCLLQDQDFSDFQLNCGGASLPVHKNILSARSPVFKRLLSSDMREAASGAVDIEDLDAPTLKKFLNFLYTGTVGEDLEVDSALKLYYAADKYEVSTLRRECVEFLCANVSVSSVCDVLCLADKHGDERLTEMSHCFILENYNEVLRSEEWSRLMRRDTLLAAETLTRFAQKDCVRKHHLHS